jgi:hypothetical protein
MLRFLSVLQALQICKTRHQHVPLQLIDFPIRGPILEFEVRGSRVAEMIGEKCRSNPLNLMRVMPPKEARVRAGLAIHHAIFRAWL